MGTPQKMKGGVDKAIEEYERKGLQEIPTLLDQTISD